ncbi:Serine-threonine/tyrosine-protein kinase, catalytic domain [Dillenia turbinata]|uniref:Serine-threonine/tyrosine-protein kinase, catalytic domain n=1 Tax=Dillenia turbinata TaxID=194707 RepID=A0AAN8ZG46_9MAGN
MGKLPNAAGRYREDMQPRSLQMTNRCQVISTPIPLSEDMDDRGVLSTHSEHVALLDKRLERVGAEGTFVEKSNQGFRVRPSYQVTDIRQGFTLARSLSISPHSEHVALLDKRLERVGVEGTFVEKSNQGFRVRLSYQVTDIRQGFTLALSLSISPHSIHRGDVRKQLISSLYVSHTLHVCVVVYECFNSVPTTFKLLFFSILLFFFLFNLSRFFNKPRNICFSSKTQLKTQMFSFNGTLQSLCKWQAVFDLSYVWFLLSGMILEELGDLACLVLADNEISGFILHHGVPKTFLFNSWVLGGIVVGSMFLTVLVALALLKWLQRIKGALKHQSSHVREASSKITLVNNLEAINNFCKSNIIGDRGFGTVYKAMLPDGRSVAVKRLNQAKAQGHREFLAEMETLEKVKHHNLVPLLGDIKASNFLLNEDFEPKVADFGQARLIGACERHVVPIFLEHLGTSPQNMGRAGGPKHE